MNIDLKLLYLSFFLMLRNKSIHIEIFTHFEHINNGEKLQSRNRNYGNISY